MKELFAIANKLNTKIGLLYKLILAIKLRLCIFNIKKSIINESSLSKTALMQFIHFIKYSCSYLDDINESLFSQWFRITDSSDGIVFDITCSPIRLCVYGGSNISYRYELFVTDYTGDRMIHTNRDLTMDILDRNSNYDNDKEVYDIIRSYIEASISISKDAWLDKLKSI